MRQFRRPATGWIVALLAVGAAAQAWADAPHRPPASAATDATAELVPPVWVKGDPVADGPDAAQVAWQASGPSGPQGGDYDSIKALPDWSGGWALDDESFAKTRAASGALDEHDPNIARLQPKWDAYRRANGAANGGRGPEHTGVVNNARQCMPDGMPGMMTTPLAFEYLFTPGRVTINSSSGESRRVYTDGRKHSDNPDLKFPGESIGRWEGDTLVIDTTAILPKSEIFVGLPEAPGTHVYERIRRISATKLEIRTIVNNPKIFRQPFAYTRTYDRIPEISFDNCFENLRDKGDEIDLTAPPMEQ